MSAWLPSTLKRLEDRTFSGCKSLKDVQLRQGLESIGKQCFSGSGIEEVTLPGTLMEIEDLAFHDCSSLTVVWVEADCLVDVQACVSDSVAALRRDTAVGDQPLWWLRQQSDVVIPEGVETIGDRWFMGSKVENVEIPASVRHIGKEAFRGCQELKQVIFAAGSGLESIDELCFAYSGAQNIDVPQSLRTIARNAFKGCANMKLGRLCSEYTCADGLRIVVKRTTFRHRAEN